MYLEINAKCCWNFIKFNKIDLTLMYEATIKKCLPKWDRATPLMKKWNFYASNNFVSITELLFKWIEVGWTKVAWALHTRKAWNSSCNLLPKEVDRMGTKFFFVNCLNGRRQVLDDIWEHVLCDRIMKNYTTWIWHGELIEIQRGFQSEPLDLEMGDC